MRVINIGEKLKEKISGISTIDKEKMEFYYAAFDNASIEIGRKFDLHLNYLGKAATIFDIKGWNDIRTAIDVLVCDNVTFKYTGSKYLPGASKRNITLHFKIERIEEIQPEITTSIETPPDIIPEKPPEIVKFPEKTGPTSKEDEQILKKINRKFKGGKNGKSNRDADHSG